MSKLLKKVICSGAILPERMTLVNIQNVANWYLSDERRPTGPDGFPITLPPWPISWLEYNVPSTITWHDGQIAASNALGMPRQVGAAVQAIHLDEEQRSRIGTHGDPARRTYLNTIREAGGRESDVSGELDHFLQRVAASSDGIRHASCGRLVAYDGRVTGSPGHWVAYHRADGSIAPGCYLAGRSQSFSIQALWLSIGSVYAAIAMAHCKNVHLSGEELSELPTSDRLRSRRKAKRPRLTFRTLLIEPLMSASRGVSGRGADIANALHMCRGHFKDYRDHGLFGRHKGVYWWDQHARGDARSGLVVKDYKIGSAP